MRSRRGRRGRIWLPDPLSDHPLNTGLVGCWDGLINDPFIGGSMARDIAPYRYHGTLVNGTTWEPGPYGGYGFGFDGVSSQYVTASGSGLLDLVEELTLSFWIKTSSATTSMFVLGKYDGTHPGSSYMAWFSGASNNISFYTNDGVGHSLPSTTNVRDGNWHHIVGTFVANTSKKIYVDGKEEGSSVDGVLTSEADTAFTIGQQASGSGINSFTGLISCPRIYNRALSAAEVVALYLQQMQGSPDLYRWVNAKTYSFANPNPYRYRRSQQIVGGGLI